MRALIIYVLDISKLSQHTVDILFVSIHTYMYYIVGIYSRVLEFHRDENEFDHREKKKGYSYDFPIDKLISVQ